MPWYGWILMYGIIIPFFSLGIFIEAEIGWWFVPTCIGTILLCLGLTFLHFKLEERRERKQQQRLPK